MIPLFFYKTEQNFKLRKTSFLLLYRLTAGCPYSIIQIIAKLIIVKLTIAGRMDYFADSVSCDGCKSAFRTAGGPYPYSTQEGLSPGQPKILSYLIQHNQCRQKDLATYYNIEPATVSRLLANMEEKGLVQRESRQGEQTIGNCGNYKKGRTGFCPHAGSFCQD